MILLNKETKQNQKYMYTIEPNFGRGIPISTSLLPSNDTVFQSVKLWIRTFYIFKYF